MTLQALQLSQARGDRSLFEDLSFEVPPGHALWVRGPNGSGKTSLLRVLCGLAVAAAGEVRWQGQPVRAQRETYHRSLVYCGHASGVKDDFNALENVLFGAALAGQRCSPAQALEALGRMGLSAVAQRPARSLSQGQRKRLALARLCLAPPAALLVLDEPITALDAEAVDGLRQLLDRHLAHDGVVVYTTHEPLALRAERLQVLELLDARVPCVAR